jgi:hypothetical protein
MTEFATIDAQDTHAMGFTENTVNITHEEEFNTFELKYKTGMYINDLVVKAAKVSNLSTRTDTYLYELLQDCYESFLVIDKPNSSIASEAQSQLNKYCSKNGIKNSKSSKLINKLLQCVFQGADRSKISTYGYVLKYAVKKQIAAGELAKEIKLAGGIQQIKKASFAEFAEKSKIKTATQLNKAQSSLCETNMGTIEVLQASRAMSAFKTGDQVVLIATVNDDGKFVIRAATTEEHVINTAVLAVAKPKTAQTAKAITETA